MSQHLTAPLCGNTSHDYVRTTGSRNIRSSNHTHSGGGSSRNDKILKALMRFRHNSRSFMQDSHLEIEEILCRELYRCILSEDRHGFENVITIVNLQRFESAKWTPLMTCVQKNKFAFTKKLLQQGASVHSRDPNKRVVLHVACASGWVNIAKLLLTHNYGTENRSNLNVLDKLDNTPLFEACKSGHCELIKFILLNTRLHKQICNINIQNKLGQTALHIACEKGNYEIVRQLLNYKETQCILNICDRKGHTPLLRAVRRHQYDIVKLLLKAVNVAGKHRRAFGKNCQKSSYKNSANYKKCKKNTNDRYLRVIRSPNTKKVKGLRKNLRSRNYNNNKNKNNNNNRAFISSENNKDDQKYNSDNICKSPKHMRSKWLRHGICGINAKHAHVTRHGSSSSSPLNWEKEKEKVKGEKGENRKKEIDAIGVNIAAKNGMTCLMFAAKTKDDEMLELLLFDKNIGVQHAFWLETNDKGHNVLYYLKKYKCDKKFIRHISQSLRLMLHCCLMSDCCNPPLPDAISQLIASMTY